MSAHRAVDRSTIALFWQASLRNKRQCAVALLYPLGGICMSTLAPLFVGKLLASLSLPHGNPTHYLPYFVGSVVLGLLLNRVGFAALLQLQASVMSYLQRLTLQTLLKRSVGFHNNNVGGKLVSDAIDYPAAYNQIAGAVFVNIIPLALILLVGSAVIFFESWILGLIITAMAAHTFISGILESKRRAPLRKRRLAASKAVTGHLADTIVNVQTVKTFAREARENTTHEKLNHTLLTLRLRDWQRAAFQGNNRMALLTAMQLIFIVLTIVLVHRNPALLGAGIFGFSFTITISNRLFDVGIMIRNIEDALLQASPMTEIILENPEVVDDPHAKALHVEQGAIRLQDVGFHYEDASKGQEVFSALNLSIKPGEKIGLVGPSGGGKSTLTRLLLRFEDVTAGKILIDGQNIAEVTQASLREAISYVPQEPLLFHRTIRENIAYGKDNVDDAAVVRAAKLAHADSFIDELADGYETIVGERGVKLSGGQRQRIAIARAILKDAPILVLDEATSALDSESERYIQDALKELMEGRTTLVIAHRLSTIQTMDRIIVLENGAINEQGSHQELLKKKGTYAKLWAHQSGGFLEEE